MSYLNLKRISSIISKYDKLPIDVSPGMKGRVVPFGLRNKSPSPEKVIPAPASSLLKSIFLGPYGHSCNHSDLGIIFHRFIPEVIELILYFILERNHFHLEEGV